MVTSCPTLSSLKVTYGGDVFVIPQVTENGPVTRYYIFPDTKEGVVPPNDFTTVYEKVVKIMNYLIFYNVYRKNSLDIYYVVFH